MRLVTFERRRSGAPETVGSMGAASLGFESLEATRIGTRRLGALLHDGDDAGAVVDLNRALAVRLAGEDAGAPEAEADSLLPADMAGFLRRWPDTQAVARDALAFVVDALGRYDAPDLRASGVVLPRRSVRLCAPVPRPGKILAVARNYPAHAVERGSLDLPGEPVLFMKPPSSLIGPEDEIRVPAAVSQPDYEGELVAVIGRRASRVEPATALDHVAGWCVGNDVTARDFQSQRGQHFLGKFCDTFAPTGPALVTRDEVPDPQDLSLRTTLSGEVVQSGNAKEMIFSVAEVIAFASALTTLEPGDLIFTGTPAGVGAAQEPPRWLRDGDVVEVEIEHVGRLVNLVRIEAG